MSESVFSRRHFLKSTALVAAAGALAACVPAAPAGTQAARRPRR
ncbi:MAG: twin-arginine translocation signal domain-containing protein [Caldilinea sp.]